MTISYTKEVSTARNGAFFRLLFRWRGSIYKLIWKEFLLFLVLYYIIRFVYRNLLNKSQQRIFEEISKYADSYSTLIPLSLVLGFYVKVIFSRWQSMFQSLTWPDRMAMAVTANIKGIDDRGRLIRRTIIRYMILGYIMNQTSICPSVKRRFPTLNHITQAGLMTPQEEKIIESIPQNKVNKYCVPFFWTVSVIALARKEGRIYDDYAVSVLNKELMDFRAGLGKLLRYYVVSFPLVYTQSVTIAVYILVVFILFGHQFLKMAENEGEGDDDQLVHVGALIQFFVYVGWLKLAEMMIHPFGDDDDDFDMNALIDRNIEYCYLIVDDLHSDLPPLGKDIYWDQEQVNLPYTAALANDIDKSNPEAGSAATVIVPEEKSDFVTGVSSTGAKTARRRSSVKEQSVANDVESLKPVEQKPQAGKKQPQEEKRSSAKGVGDRRQSRAQRILQSVEQQFRAFDSTASGHPFENRFLEKDEQDVDYGHEADTSSGGSGIFRTSAGFVSGAYSGVKRVVDRGRHSAPERHRKTDSSAPPFPSPPPPPPRIPPVRLSERKGE